MSVQVKEPTKGMVPTPRQELAGAEGTRPGPVFTPEVDIFESDLAITLLADLPGVAPEGLTIDLRDNVLTVDGRVEAAAREGEQVHREFRLSSVIDQGKIDAKLRNGVLRLTLPKAEAARPRKIAVHAG
jgi:HSP20 family molecular chaperone IbpA